MKPLPTCGNFKEVIFMSTYVSKNMLKKMRNNISIDKLIANILNIPNKISHGYFRFLCPVCNDFHTATNPKTNLARCFNCKKNFNPIDMVMAHSNWTFIKTVDFLKPFLEEYV